MIDERNIDATQAWKLIEARDKSELTFGYNNLATLAACKIELKGPNLDLIKTAYLNEAWVKNEQEFEKTFSK